MALHAEDGDPMDVTSLSEYIFSSPAITIRYLNLMVGKDLLEVEGDKVRLTPNGEQELLNIMSQYHKDFSA